MCKYQVTCMYKGVSHKVILLSEIQVDAVIKRWASEGATKIGVKEILKR